MYQMIFQPCTPTVAPDGYQVLDSHQCSLMTSACMHSTKHITRDSRVQLLDFRVSRPLRKTSGP